MSDRDDLTAALSKLTVGDVSIDSLGRVVLRNPDVARLLSKLQGGGRSLAPCDVGCCANVALCFCNPPSLRELTDNLKIGER
jgi:hypothetical protein